MNIVTQIRKAVHEFMSQTHYAPTTIFLTGRDYEELQNFSANFHLPWVGRLDKFDGLEIEQVFGNESHVAFVGRIAQGTEDEKLV